MTNRITVGGLELPEAPATKADPRPIIESRRNLVLNPQGADPGGAVQDAFRLRPQWFGTGGVGTTVQLTGRSDGPADVPVSAFQRKTWTTAPTSSAHGDIAFRFGGVTGTADLPKVTPGETFAVAYYWRASIAFSLTENQMYASWYDAGGALLYSGFIGAGHLPAPAANAWQFVGAVVTVPANAARVAFTHRVYTVGGQALPIGTTMDATAALIERSSVVGSFFDGSTLAEGERVFSWSGTPDASQSVAQEPDPAFDPNPRPHGFYFTDLIDWYAIPESKSDVREHPGSHGAFGIGQDWRSSLALSITGAFLGDSREDVALARRELHRAAARNVPTTVSYLDALGETSREVSIRRVTAPDEHGANEFAFTIHAIATDARRYGAPVVVSTGLPSAGGGVAYPLTFPIDWGAAGTTGRLEVTNDGDEETSSLFAVTGGLDAGFQLIHVESGRRIEFARPVPVDSTVYLDMETGTAWIDDPTNDVSGFLTRREWWSVPPLSSHSVQFGTLGAVTGTPTLTATTRPAY